MFIDLNIIALFGLDSMFKDHKSIKYSCNYSHDYPGNLPVFIKSYVNQILFQKHHEWNKLTSWLGCQ